MASTHGDIVHKVGEYVVNTKQVFLVSVSLALLSHAQIPGLWGTYEAYGKKGLTGATFPVPEQPLHDSSMGYHLRSGAHFLTEYDWVQYINFADKHLR